MSNDSRSIKHHIGQANDLRLTDVTLNITSGQSKHLMLIMALRSPNFRLGSAFVGINRRREEREMPFVHLEVKNPREKKKGKRKEKKEKKNQRKKKGNQKRESEQPRREDAGSKERERERYYS